MARAARKNANAVEAVNTEAANDTPIKAVEPETLEMSETGDVQKWSPIQNKEGDQLDSDGIKIEFDFGQFKTAAKIDEGIKSLYIVGDTARKLAHELVVASIQHYVACGDYTRLLRMFDAVRRAMGNSRETALRAYVGQNCPSLSIADEYDGKKKIGVKLVHLKGVARTYKAEQEGKLNKPFWMLEPGTPTVDFDFATALKTLLKRSKAAFESVGKHKAGEEVRNEEGKLIKRISADYNNITPEQVQQVADLFNIDMSAAR